MKHSDIRIEELLAETAYIPDAGKEIRKAFEVAEKLHKGQKRISGKPFTVHLLNTAFILAEMKMDRETVCAGLLHHSLHNPENSVSLEREFGREIKKIVEEMKRIDEIEEENEGKIKQEILAKIIMATAKDIRGLFVELAARLDNIRDADVLTENERRKMAETTMNIHVPISHKLGLYSIEWELQDLAFRILDSKNYYRIKNAIKQTREQREKKVEKIVKELRALLEKEEISAAIEGRPKSFYGIFRKSRKKNKKAEELDDLIGIRIICDSVADCYRILGIINGKYRPLEHFDDYIANPKVNNYQSLHSTIEFSSEPAEIQIRTWEMHRNAEEGLAAHWQYKNLGEMHEFDKKLGWTRQLVEMQRKLSSTDFIKSLKFDFGKNEVFVFTPKKEAIMLPEGSTPVDFAYAVHTELGSNCEKALINGKIMPLNYRLENGDTIHIIEAKKTQAKRQWLNFVKSQKARIKIRHALGMPLSDKKKEQEKKKITVNPENSRIAECCAPVPGDDIIGFKTTKRKIMIHRRNCPGIERANPKNLIEVEQHMEKGEHTVKITVRAFDRPGILVDVLNALSQCDAKLNKTAAKSEGQFVSCSFDLNVTDAKELNKITEKLSGIPAVHSVERK